MNTLAKDEPHKVYGDYAQLIAKASTIRTYQIADYPVVSPEQLPNIPYIYDYEIERIYEHDKSSASSFTEHLLDTNQYIFGNQRMCPFVGRYAVEFIKGKFNLTILFSDKACSKIIIFCPGTPIDKKHIDLGENSQIYSALIPLVTDKK